MFKSREVIPFYLYHIFILSTILFCWCAVTVSYMNNPSYVSVLEHFKGITLSNFYVLFFDPFLAYSLLPLSLIILYSFRKERYITVHVLFIILPSIVILEFDTYYIGLEQGVFLYSKIGMLMYSMKVLMVLAIQFYVFLVTKKALKY